MIKFFLAFIALALGYFAYVKHDANKAKREARKANSDLIKAEVEKESISASASMSAALSEALRNMRELQETDRETLTPDTDGRAEDGMPIASAEAIETPLGNNVQILQQNESRAIPSSQYETNRALSTSVIKHPATPANGAENKIGSDSISNEQASTAVNARSEVTEQKKTEAQRDIPTITRFTAPSAFRLFASRVLKTRDTAPSQETAPILGIDDVKTEEQRPSITYHIPQPLSAQTKAIEAKEVRESITSPHVSNDAPVEPSRAPDANIPLEDANKEIAKEQAKRLRKLRGL